MHRNGLASFCRHGLAARPACAASARRTLGIDGAALSGIRVGAAAAAAAATIAATRPAVPVLPTLRRVFLALPAHCEEAVAPAAGSVPHSTLAAASAAAPAAKPEVLDHIPPEARPQSNTVRLYQFESCPFCRKVRSCLDYHKISYEIVEVHPLNKAETKEIAPDYKKVPILRIDAEGRHLQLRDSKTIVRALLGSSNPGVGPKVPPPSATASTGKMWSTDNAVGSVEEQWIKWTDVVLVQCIVLNVYRNMKESAETFRYLLTHSSFPWLAQRSAAWSGTVVMWAVAKSRKKKFEVKDERAALYEAVGAFASAVRDGGGPFLGGERPGTVDFNVYGILRSAEACQTERDMLEFCPDIHPWYNSMTEAVGPSCAVNKDTVKRG